MVEALEKNNHYNITNQSGADVPTREVKIQIVPKLIEVFEIQNCHLNLFGREKRKHWEATFREYFLREAGSLLKTPCREVDPTEKRQKENLYVMKLLQCSSKYFIHRSAASDNVSQSSVNLVEAFLQFKASITKLLDFSQQFVGCFFA